MKKFLFTLAALFMTSTAFAECALYIDDFEVAQAELGTEICIPVKAHFDARLNAYDVEFTYPEGLVATFVEAGADMSVQSYNARGRATTFTATLYGAMEPYEHFIATIGEMGYWQPEEGGAWEAYGAVKWEAGEYEEMLLLYFEPAADFQGGEIVVKTTCSSGFDNRGGTTKDNGDEGVQFTRVCNVTVEGGVTPPADLTGQIVIGQPTEDGLVAISYTGEEDVTMEVVLNGETVELVDGNIQLVEGMNIITVTVSAEGYNSLTATAEYEWVAPQPQPVDLEGDIVVSEPDENGIVTVTYDGTEDVTVTVTVNGEVVEGEIQLVEGENTIVVTVEGEGYNTMTETYTIVWTPGETPEDPHMTGYWLVEINHNGELIYTELLPGLNGDYINVDDVVYPEFWDVAAFYFLINGEAYGAVEDMTEAFLGDADQNPLVPGENTYFVGVGYSYTFGIHFIYDVDTMEFQGYSAYVAKGGPVDVDEVAAGKTVAGVRYYNMAGQEMQEANGMTIVVTTYTDGTTSAVKVIK